MKFIQLTMSDHSVWQVPASFVADHRARYFDERDDDTTYEEEFEYTINSEEELLDWFMGSFNWDDIAPIASMISPPRMLDYSDEWLNADKEVVEC